MWTCSMLKTNARNALRGRYWRSFWGCFLIALLSGGGVTNLSVLYSPEEASRYLESLPSYFLVWVLVASLIGAVLGILWSIFISGVLEVGSCRYFMESRQSPSPISTFFSVFQTPYLNVVKVSFLTSLKITVGMFLLVIPGIYWTYCYALVPYLLAENPYLSTSRAMELSKEIMYGEKLHFFILELSFLGWILLCILTLGIGSYFLFPYMNATFAEFYAAMRAKALAQGLTTTHELGGFVRHDASRF
ncbi:DUF975 family protein [Subdoligranulum variabile]|nr:DUF975 family protein [Subdoligranulum variabile]UWP67979.1 DUF975 family protein [Subdoligranulum variabile]